MGSMIMTETFDVEKLQAMCDAFAELPYKVLWKADVEKLPKTLSVPDNIHFEKWMPQLDILCTKYNKRNILNSLKYSRSSKY
jgi:glucuronosyltransferase